MKGRSVPLAVLLAAGVLAGAIVLLRPLDAPVVPQPWIVDAARALNRGPIRANAQAGMTAPVGAQTGVPQRVLEGQQLRVQRKFAECAAAFREAVKVDPMDADSWADLADCEAAAAGNDLTQGRDAIMRAIAIDPRHRKALWLRASLELQEQRYTEAAATWRELEPLVAAGSADARVIAANIVEADAQARMGLPPDGRGG